MNNIAIDILQKKLDAMVKDEKVLRATAELLLAEAE